MTKKKKPNQKKDPIAWVNTRIQKKKRDAVDRLVEDGKYPSRSAFFRTAIDNQLEKDLLLDDAVTKVVR